jgi:hypothetical protein
MTLVTGAPTFGRLLAVGLLLAGCSETTAPPISAPPTIAASQIELPPPAPLPPPPKPAPPARAPSKPATAKLAGNGAEPTAEANAGSVSEDSGKSQATERTAEPTPVPPAEPPTQTDAAIARGAALTLAARPPIRLIGLNRTSTAALLGAPSDERQIAAARVWDYRGPECRLAVYFYLDTGRNDFYALHYEIDGPPAGPDADQHCLHRIRDDARNR